MRGQRRKQKADKKYPTVVLSLQRLGFLLLSAVPQYTKNMTTPDTACYRLTTRALRLRYSDVYDGVSPHSQAVLRYILGTSQQPLTLAELQQKARDEDIFYEHEDIAAGIRDLLARGIIESV
jgi:hypothetical protein